MSDIVNLNQFKKKKARQDEKRRADENAVKFGRTKAEKTHDKAEEKRETRHLDGHQLED